MSNPFFANNRKHVLRSYYNLVIIILVAVIIIDLATIIHRKNYRSDIKIIAGDELQCNPNTATAEELAMIPSITYTQAQAIVAYRINYQKKYPNRTVFKGTDDLYPIKGMSKNKLAKIKKFFKFPEPARPHR